MKLKKISENIIEVNGKKYIKQESIEGEWIKIPELKIEVQKEVHDKGKSWNDLRLSEREKELLTAEQCIWLANSKYDKTLKMDCSYSTNDDFFIQQPFKTNKEKGYVAGFYSYSYGSNLSFDRGADGSYRARGVRFVRPLKKK